MVFTRVLVLLALALAIAACGGDDGDGDTSAPGITAEARDQLQYLDPRSSFVLALDLRYEEDNWDDLRPVASKLLRAVRRTARTPETRLLSPNLDGALEQAASYAGLKFEDDLRPLLDGHLVVGSVERGRDEGDETIWTYTTKDGDLRSVVERLLEGSRPRPLEGYDDVDVIDGEVALVGDRTILLVESGSPDDRASERVLRAALDRHRDGAGVPAERLATAATEAGIADPLLLATGDLTVAQAQFDRGQVDRAREAVPYLRALQRASIAFDVEPGAARARAHVATGGEPLRPEDLPVGEAGDLAVPESDVIAGASTNQSRTTILGARIARAAFPRSRFVRAIERAERDLGIRFEEDVLAQFSCPSVSVLEPRPTAEGQGVRRFGARSCVRDPEELRDLLPRLRPHLPAILTGLLGLGDTGLAGLLLVAPDAPLTPGGLLADIVVRPFGGGEPDDTLYEITGLRDDPMSATAQAGPDRLLFGFIGDDFVVASDPEMAREVAGAETEPLDRRGGSGLRVPLDALIGRDPDADELTRALGEVVRTLTVTVTADPEKTVAEADLPFSD